MIRAVLLLAMLASTSCVAKDPPKAEAGFRVGFIKEHIGACIRSLEDTPEFHALFSARTIEVYCSCRQGYRADVIAQANLDHRRGKAVSDESDEYAKRMCSPILLEQRESE